MKSSVPYVSLNIERIGLLPINWIDSILNVIKSSAYFTNLEENSSTSITNRTLGSVNLYVVDGLIVFKELLWLYSLYCNELLQIANSRFNDDYVISNDLKSSVNINVLKNKGSSYEWHYDSNPLTGLLFLTSHSSEEGGQLIFDMGYETISVNPVRGDFMLFDAREIPHCVSSLNHNHSRISIPMNYYFKGQPQDRPDDLNAYLYRKS